MTNKPALHKIFLNEALTKKEPLSGFKGFGKTKKGKLKCRSTIFDTKEKSLRGKIQICHSGFHFCPYNFLDVLEFYPLNAFSVFHHVTGYDNYHRSGIKIAVKTIKVGKKINVLKYLESLRTEKLILQYNVHSNYGRPYASHEGIVSRAFLFPKQRQIARGVNVSKNKNKNIVYLGTFECTLDGQGIENIITMYKKILKDKNNYSYISQNYFARIVDKIVLKKVELIS